MDYSRKKNKAGRVGGWGRGGHTFLNPPFLWKVFYFALGNSRQNKASPLENPQNWAIPEKKQQGFPNSGKRWGGIRNFTCGDFFTGEGNLRKSDFDNSNLFQS